MLEVAASSMGLGDEILAIGAGEYTKFHHLHTPIRGKESNKSHMPHNNPVQHQNREPDSEIRARKRMKGRR
jgi:hypothetical protein